MIDISDELKLEEYCLHWETVDAPKECPKCHGTGYYLTNFGQDVLRAVKRHLETTKVSK